MNFMIIDDDKTVHTILGLLLKQNNLGTVIAELDQGQDAASEIMFYQPDILLIDLLMPGQNGLEILEELNQKGYEGKVIMISCVDEEDMITEAYDKGVSFFINKPINYTETVSVLRNVIKMIELERVMSQIKSAINLNENVPETEQKEKQMNRTIAEIFTDIGIVGLSGTDEIWEVLMRIHEIQKVDKNKKYQLKQIYREVSRQMYPVGDPVINQKNMEQRIRRTIQKALSNLAEMGHVDYYGPVFTKYANVLFDFKQVRQEMEHIKDPQKYGGKINTKKFMEGILSRVD